MNCNFCHEEKPESEFYDSNKSKCKLCVRAGVKANRIANADYYREYDRARFKEDPKVAERHRRYQRTEAGKTSVSKSKRRYRSENPAKFKSHNILNNAMRDGHISRKDCEICNSPFTQAHHDDYFKPLLVRWLCAAHHKQWHDANGEAANGSASIEEFNVAVYGLKQA